MRYLSENRWMEKCEQTAVTRDRTMPESYLTPAVLPGGYIVGTKEEALELLRLERERREIDDDTCRGAGDREEDREA